MRNLVVGLMGAAALAMASAANATITVTGTSFTSYSGPTTTDGGVTTTIGYADTGLGRPTFTEWLKFTNTLSGIYSVTLDTSSRSVDFTSAYLTNGVDTFFLSKLYSVGSLEGWGLDDTLIAAGNYTLFVKGKNTRTGSLGGTITIAALPEPGTWAMMIIGFGAVGFSLRRKRKTALLGQIA